MRLFYFQCHIIAKFIPKECCGFDCVLNIKSHIFNFSFFFKTAKQNKKNCCVCDICVILSKVTAVTQHFKKHVKFNVVTFDWRIYCMAGHVPDVCANVYILNYWLSCLCIFNLFFLLLLGEDWCTDIAKVFEISWLFNTDGSIMVC